MPDYLPLRLNSDFRSLAHVTIEGLAFRLCGVVAGRKPIDTHVVSIALRAVACIPFVGNIFLGSDFPVLDVRTDGPAE